MEFMITTADVNKAVIHAELFQLLCKELFHFLFLSGGIVFFDLLGDLTDVKVSGRNIS